MVKEEAGLVKRRELAVYVRREGGMKMAVEVGKSTVLKILNNVYTCTVVNKSHSFCHGP